MIEYLLKGVDRVLEKTLWKLFEKTGNIQAYLYYKSTQKRICSKHQGIRENSNQQALLR